jgi:hypothetical protein
VVAPLHFSRSAGLSLSLLHRARVSASAGVTVVRPGSLACLQVTPIRNAQSRCSNLYADRVFKNCSELETQPKLVCITKMDASWLLVGAFLPIDSLV